MSISHSKLEIKYNVIITQRNKELVSHGKKYMIKFSDKSYTDYDFNTIQEVKKYLKDTTMNEEIVMDNQVKTESLKTLDRSQLNFEYQGVYADNAFNFLNEIININDKDAIEVYISKYIEDLKNSMSLSNSKKYTANIRNCLVNYSAYLAKFFNEDFLKDDLVFFGYDLIKLTKEDYEKLQNRDTENRIKKIDDKIALTDEIIKKYIDTAIELLIKKEDYFSVVLGICALTARRETEISKTLTNFDIDTQYTLQILKDETIKTKTDTNEVITCYCLAESSLIYDSLNWLREHEKYQELKDLTNDSVHNRVNKPVNRKVKKIFNFLPSPSTKEENSIHVFRAVSATLIAHFFTNENNDYDEMLKKALAHDKSSNAKDFYKSYYVPSNSSFKRGYLLGKEDDFKTIEITEYQENFINNYGGLDNIIKLLLERQFNDSTSDDSASDDSASDDNSVIEEIKEEIKEDFKDNKHHKNKHYDRIIKTILDIKKFNDSQQNKEDKIAITSTAIYQLLGIRTPIISQFRLDNTDYDFDLYNNNLMLDYRQNSGKDLKQLLGY